MSQYSHPPKNGQIALWPSTNREIPQAYFCQVVNGQLLRFCQVVNGQLLTLLGTNIVVHQSLEVNLYIKVSKIPVDLIIEPILFL